jgi:tRNA threonylcarbamoyladenosine biosynthesis protein TsaB
MSEKSLLVAIDTCGPAGSVALGRLSADVVEIDAEQELEGRSYSATLTVALARLVEEAGARLADIGGIVVVHGPGSFTGVRIGLSTAKGLAEGLGIPIVAVSRLAVLAAKAGTGAAALDAHRNEVFLRLEQASGQTIDPALKSKHRAPSISQVLSRNGWESYALSKGRINRELLAGAAELAAVAPSPERVAVCDDSAARLVGEAWPAAELAFVAAPLASDALRLGALRLSAGQSDDVLLLDGNYLRRSDAEIFGEAAAGVKSA